MITKTEAGHFILVDDFKASISDFFPFFQADTMSVGELRQRLNNDFDALARTSVGPTRNAIFSYLGLFHVSERTRVLDEIRRRQRDEPEVGPTVHPRHIHMDAELRRMQEIAMSDADFGSAVHRQVEMDSSLDEYVANEVNEMEDQAEVVYVSDDSDVEDDRMVVQPSTEEASMLDEFRRSAISAPSVSMLQDVVNQSQEVLMNTFDGYNAKSCPTVHAKIGGLVDDINRMSRFLVIPQQIQSAKEREKHIEKLNDLQENEVVHTHNFEEGPFTVPVMNTQFNLDQTTLPMYQKYVASKATTDKLGRKLLRHIQKNRSSCSTRRRIQGQGMRVNCPTCYSAYTMEHFVFGECRHVVCRDCYNSMARNNRETCSVCRTKWNRVQVLQFEDSHVKLRHCSTINGVPDCMGFNNAM